VSEGVSEGVSGVQRSQLSLIKKRASARSGRVSEGVSGVVARRVSSGRDGRVSEGVSEGVARRLGEGGSGVVVRARRRSDAAPVALKLFGE
jgi:hypothetical protein